MLTPNSNYKTSQELRRVSQLGGVFVSVPAEIINIFFTRLNGGSLVYLSVYFVAFFLVSLIVINIMSPNRQVNEAMEKIVGYPSFIATYPRR